MARWRTDAWFVVAATGRADVDGRVAAEARARRLFCTRSDDARAASVVVPAVGRHDDLTVAVHSPGDAWRAKSVRDAVQTALLSMAPSSTAATGSLPPAWPWSGAGPVIRGC